MYRIIDYFTDEIIDTVFDEQIAIRICENNEGSQVETEDGAIVYTNVDLPF